MSRALTIAPLLVLLAFGALDEPATKTAEIPLGPVWVVGDSIGVGIASALRRAGTSVEDNAQISTTARQWSARLASGKYWPPSPALIVVSLGTNDQASAELLREFRSNAARLMKVLQGAGHTVIWVLPPSQSSRIPRGNDLEFFQLLGGTWVLDQQVPMADTWHPTAAGYDRLALAIETIRKGR